MSKIDRREGRRLFGADPAAYELARPGHPERVYDVLVERCGLGPGTAVLEIGPGTGQATRRLLELGAEPLVAVEPDPALAEYLRSTMGERLRFLVTSLEDAEIQGPAFDLAVAASSFHWVEEEPGLAKIGSALRPGAWCATWWTLFGEGDRKDTFMQAVDPLLVDLARSPSAGEAGRPPFGLDAEARLAVLSGAGFECTQHELIRWSAAWDVPGIRALYGSFSPIRRLDDERREALLDDVARIAERDFEGRVERLLTTSLYTARLPR